MDRVWDKNRNSIADYSFYISLYLCYTIVKSKKGESMMQFYGVDAMVRIVSHLLFIYITFWTLQSIRLDQFFKMHHNRQVRLLLVFFSIVIGFTVSSFFLEFIALCRNLFIGLFS